MADGRPIIDEVDPAQAYGLLSSDPAAVLVDVRTSAEWAFVGLPDLSALGRQVATVEWISFPDMARNAIFLDQLTDQLRGEIPQRLFFICRSGSRSMAAAQWVAGALSGQGRSAHCTNVAEGFEGDIDHEGHRGSVNGWKVRGLPWRQN